MAEKSNFFDGTIFKRGLNKFDATLLTNDGGKYSPSIRRLRQNYFYDTKCLTNKLLLSPTSSTAKQLSRRVSDPQSSSSHHHQSSINVLVTSLKCDHCHKNEGLFQCCHCNQHFCIRCCNKHHKKVTVECEHLHELSNSLLTKIMFKRSELERQKKETIEQCHKWRIDTINTINKAHKLIIQTINDEYELLNKQYELFIQKKMSYINIAENELIDIEKRNLISLLLPLSSSQLTTTNSIKTIDSIKENFESLTKDIDEKGNFSLQVKLPLLDMKNNLKVESHASDNIKVISAIWQNIDYIDDISFNQRKETSKNSSDSPLIVTNVSDISYSSAIEENLLVQFDYFTNIFDSNISSSSIDSSLATNQLDILEYNHPHERQFEQILSFPISSIDNAISNSFRGNQNTYENNQINCENKNSEHESKSIDL